MTSTDRTPTRRTFVLTILAGAVLLVGAGAPALAQEARSLEELLADVREATGVEARSALGPALAATGHSDALGLDSEVHLLCLPGGRFVQRTTSRLPRSEGFDGTETYTRDWSGATRRLEHADREEILLLNWFTNGYWLEAGAPVVVELAAEDGSEAPKLSLRLKDGRISGTVEIDPDSWLPRSLAITSSGSGTELVLDSWTEVRDVQLPFEWRHTEGEGQTITTRLSKAEVLAAIPESPFEHFHRPPDHTRFLEGISTEIELRRAVTGHLLIPALVDGEDRGWFILDTGAGTLCLSPEIADACEMEALGEVEARGVSGSLQAGFRLGRTLTIGPLEIAEPVFLEIDLAFLEPIFGVKVAGVAGAELFCRSVVEIDLGEERVRVAHPESYELPGEASWSKLSFESRLPCFPVTYEGDRSGLFRFDSGSEGSVELDWDTVEREALLEGRETSPSGVRGVVGFRPVDVGPLEWLEVGGLRFEGIEGALFSRPGETASRSAWTEGVMGLALFADHTLVFDYSAERFTIIAPR